MNIPVTHRVGIAKTRSTPFAGHSTGYVLNSSYSEYRHTATTPRGVELIIARVLSEAATADTVMDVQWTEWGEGKGGAVIVFTRHGSGVTYSDTISASGDWSPSATAERYAARVQREGGRLINPSRYTR